MPKRKTSIPVNIMANEFGLGIVIERNQVKNLRSAGFEDALQPHREDGYSFFLR
ncbi:hypothetical protein HF324_00365 [Chitinophaga oryzae]|uniref:Uncharacterized protein n=1 Tax=Chitinophaga oryzae TaxID=2725414 RepID=A0ABX6L8X1_9BACT|nr:hypothetical protein [Chitinophaga oryzae]QJB36399.1 hypothetical protein HF324_00365 [Chitinophaga oryzae]